MRSTRRDTRLPAAFTSRRPKDLGMSPTRFRERGLNETIRFATAPCELGLLLVAATERGVCSVMLGDGRGGAGGIAAAAVSARRRLCRMPRGMTDQVAGRSRRHDRSSGGWDSAGCARDCIPGAGLAGFARDSARRDAQLMRKWHRRSDNQLRCGLWPGLAPPTRSPLLFLATALSAATARLPATAGAWSGRRSCWRWREPETLGRAGEIVRLKRPMRL